MEVLRGEENIEYSHWLNLDLFYGKDVVGCIFVTRNLIEKGQ